MYEDIERGRSWQGVESGQVDLSELTWEQKEQVLRCVPVWEGVPQFGRVCPSLGESVPVWEGLFQCGRCVLVWKGLS